MSTESQYHVGLDIGGSHFSAGIVIKEEGRLILKDCSHKRIDSSSPLLHIIDSFVAEITGLWAKNDYTAFNGISFSFPGPFLYEKGVSCISSLHKYDHLFAADLKELLQNRLGGRIVKTPPTFINDAQAFLLGAVEEFGWKHERVMAISIGTGLGSAFYDRGIATENKQLPNNGCLYNLPYKEGIAEDYLSSRWVIKRYRELTGAQVEEVKSIAVSGDAAACRVFAELGEHLARVISPVCQAFNPDKIVFGGNIFKSYHLFKKSFLSHFSMDKKININVASDTSSLAIKGAVAGRTPEGSPEAASRGFRKTAQQLLPVKKQRTPEGYDIFPAFNLHEGTIRSGFSSLADWINQHQTVVIDGYTGVCWEHFIQSLNRLFRQKEIAVNWFSIDAALKDYEQIEALTAPFLGGDDPVFGRIYPGTLTDFFDAAQLEKIRPAAEGLNILYGPGAALAGWDAPVVFLDVPKNEIQYRSRAGAVTNIGQQKPASAKEQYKRFFYVDWVVMNKHKKSLLPTLSLIVDEQRIDDITWMEGDAFRKALDEVSQHAFRVRPWFEAGAWGGSWIKEHIEGVPLEVPNYAWSFELITPENGIILENGGNLLEVSFDFLMYRDNEAVLGKAANRFGDAFPIRFDFLDTFDGGNLSVQCHPKPDYIKDHFGENFTQDETYYMLDTRKGAEVYLGFRDDIQPETFKKALKKSASENTRVEITDFVQTFPARKHDLFLIPSGTVHCSGINNMVLEISSTPYIYTFKMYDWLRLDLDGNPRPLNIDRAFENLDFNLKGEAVKKELLSSPVVIDQGPGWEILDLPTHREHFYSIRRAEFESEVSIETKGQCHILSLVEGQSVTVETAGRDLRVQYAETFVIPASVEKYTLRNKGAVIAKVVFAFVKEAAC